MAHNSDLKLINCTDLKEIRGVAFPKYVKFRQLIITGPPGSGKSTLLSRIRGWPLEGYIDLTQAGWWRDPFLTYRPREVHLGFPFYNHKEALSVFDKAWLEAPEPLEVDFSRIQIPPENKSMFASNLRRKFVFEFLVPPAKKALGWRTKRSDSDLYKSDKKLTLEMIERQNAVFMETAAYLHAKGMQVHVREGYEGAPKCFREKTAAVETRPAGKTGSARRLASALPRPWKRHFVPLKKPYAIKTQVRVKHGIKPFQVMIGRKALLVVPDVPLSRAVKKYPHDWLVINPDVYFKRPGGVIKVKEGESVSLGRAPLVRTMLGLPRSLEKQPVVLSNNRGDLVINREQSIAKVQIGKPQDKTIARRFTQARRNGLKACRAIYGRPFKPLPQDQAMELLKRVNAILRHEKYRPASSANRPGAVFDLPEKLAPIIVGDLHANIDNLLKVLSQPGVFKALEENKACVILLGDVVHRDDRAGLEEMDTSILMLDFICKLKERFPKNFFFIRGNHESFSPEVSKGGISQGPLFKTILREERGDKYVQEVERFFRRMAYIVKSDRFIATHASPLSRITNYQTLVDLAKYKGFTSEITTNRARKPGFPFGYTKGAVRRFRGILEVPETTPFLVGHSMPDEVNGFWPDIAKIKNHHIVYSSGEYRFGVVTGFGDGLIPFEPGSEPLLKIANQTFKKKSPLAQRRK